MSCSENIRSYRPGKEREHKECSNALETIFLGCLDSEIEIEGLEICETFTLRVYETTTQNT